MPLTKEKPTAQFAKAKQALKEVRIDDVDSVEITNLTDGGVRIEVVIYKHHGQKRKWAKFADELHKASPLRGQSKIVTDGVREFREGFSFDRE